MKKFLSITLALVLTFAMASSAFAALSFTDVTENDWFYAGVSKAVELGLINGKSETLYAPNDNLTYAEAVKLAACMNQFYVDGSVTLASGDPWFMPYVTYATQKGIIKKVYPYTEKITRADFMEIFANALPDEALKAISYVPDNSIPDVPSTEPYAAGVYKLYRAGILTGVDAAHNCLPLSNIKRSEVAVILTRMMDEKSRITFNIGTPPVQEEVAKLTIEQQPQDLTVQTGVKASFIVVASGGVAPYTYSWLYQNGSSWIPLPETAGMISGTKNSMVSFTTNNSITMNLRCIVTDAAGNKIVSSAAKLLILPPMPEATKDLQIATQPSAVTLSVGEDAVVSVEVKDGKEPYTYQWQMNGGGSVWLPLNDNDMMSGTKASTLTLKSVAASWIDVRCVVRDSNGNSVTTNTVRVEFK